MKRAASAAVATSAYQFAPKNSQIMLYEIDQLETPTSVQELIDFGYLKKGQDTCPDHSQVVIENGQAISK